MDSRKYYDEIFNHESGRSLSENIDKVVHDIRHQALEEVKKVVEEMRLDADVFYNKKNAQEILTAIKEELEKLQPKIDK
jgi:vacuolar-type H+-ATPase subunit E/Vma4